jgi:hypothetical protein
MMAALVFDAPAWLALLALPLALAWWTARNAAAPDEPTGALELWRAAQLEAPHSARGARRWPLRTLCALAALAAACLALAEPVWRPEAGPVVWRVVVDARAALGLPAPSEAAGSVAGQTRAQRASALAAHALERVLEPGDRSEWWLVSGEHVLATSSTLPADWPPLHEQLCGHSAPAWERYDELGTLWVSDCGAELAPRHAGLAASGASVTPGVVARWPGRALDWNGRETAELTESAPLVALALDARRGPLGRALAAWCSARGVTLCDPAACGDAAALRVEFAALDAGERSVGGSAGWSLAGRSGVLAPSVRPHSVLLAEEGPRARPLLRVARGQVECALEPDAELSGDGAAFAITCAEAFDRALLPVAPVVALEERQRSEAPREIAPRRPADPSAPPRSLAGWCAAAAALLALGAAALRR